MNLLKRIKIIICSLLVLMSFVNVNNRNIIYLNAEEVEGDIYLDAALYEDFINYEMDSSTLVFSGELPYEEDYSGFFSETNITNENDYSIQIESYFIESDFELVFSATLFYQNDMAVEMVSLNTNTFINDFGFLDVNFEYDGETYLLSECIAQLNDEINQCDLRNAFTFFASVKIIVVVIMAVCKAVSLIKARSNYSYNTQLEANGLGVNSGTYITDQTQTIITGHKCGGYKFGYTYFSNVGCEVASAYNLMISLNRAEMLSETIYTFEKEGIEYTFALGYLGSNAKLIYKYLNKKNLSYQLIDNWSDFTTNVGQHSNCHIIMSRWNNNPAANGYHTFYIKKNNSQSFDSYNWCYRDYDNVNRSNISSFNDGSGFIVGYII